MRRSLLLMLVLALAGTANFLSAAQQATGNGNKVVLTIAAAPAAEYACSDEASLTSPSTKTKAELVVTNGSKGNITLYWLNFQSRRQKYADIPPGDVYHQDSYAGHIWLLADDTGRCLRITTAPGNITMH
jgi:hypothetical protein